MKIRQIISTVALSLLCMGFASCNPTAKITVHVVTDEGKELANFPVNFQARVGWTPGEGFGTDRYSFWTNFTDSSGSVTTKGGIYGNELDIRTGDISGFYGGGIDYRYTNAIAGKMQPWNPTVELIVKPIINPIPMYAQAVRSTLPVKGSEVGFDLEAGDWVAPYGKGITSDFILKLTEKIPFVSGNNPYDVNITLSFSNKGDGIQSVIVPINEGSALRLPRYAPESGYQAILSQELSLSGNTRLNGADGEDQNYFFRVRTVLDEQGNVKSALYGKIAGPLLFGAQGYVQFTYYLNPNPNDRNMEFDPGKNLFQNLSILQQVKAP